jgi:hypothetical protein
MTQTNGSGFRVPGSRFGGASGFTLLELIVIVAVLAILAAAVTPAVMQQILDTRIETTQDETRVLYEAMVGPPTGETRFGFAGDIGRLPNSFRELVQPSGLPLYTTNTVRSVGMGWRGPYVNTGTSSGDAFTDGFGRPYTIESGQVSSAGPDGIAGNADDIVYPPFPPTVTGDVSVSLKEMQGNKVTTDPSGYRVDLYYALNGVEAVVSDTGVPYTFSGVPIGLHAVRVVKTSNPKSGSIVVEDIVVVRAGSTAVIELWF